MTVDDDKFDSPFGYAALFFPLGQFSSDLFVGGISHSQTNLLRFGVLRDGFKGKLDSIHINGKAVDFSDNMESEAVAFIRENDLGDAQGQNDHDYHFGAASSFAEFGKCCSTCKFLPLYSHVQTY